MWILVLTMSLNAVPGTTDTMEAFVGDVTTHILPNLQPGTTYDLKVYAQYDAGMSGALIGQGTTCTCWILWLGNHVTRFRFNGINRGVFFSVSVYLNVTDLQTYNVGYDSFCIRWTPHRAATSYRLKVNPFIRKLKNFRVLPDAVKHCEMSTCGQLVVNRCLFGSDVWVHFQVFWKQYL